MSNEGTPANPETSTPKEMYISLLRQVGEIARRLQGKLVAKDPDSSEELLHVDASPESFTFVFSTTKLNISKIDEPRGAYPNTFSLTFDPERMSISYTEALPPRPANITFEIDAIEDTQTFRKNVLPIFEKLNLLLSYFHVDSQVKIP